VLDAREMDQPRRLGEEMSREQEAR
jgi:hypothetical protein